MVIILETEASAGPVRQGFLKSEDKKMAMLMSSYQEGPVLSTEGKEERCH